ncbi:TIGR04283 family arsenosugar biosynthesis glycosyltransferase [Marivirga atlantica]|jgi:rSAM/selenodomain-associated transferase 2|uniref:TIGR04283 family arsenosugar biosynthesis glycosyltransferase n=1 Tax=Marivirga atlantica TaxID=1548457 RepID=A0A937A7P5_9BACT|nr:TIGR04283 family arsenosugar biosynthesis glycosyltransferase [Marivirga atlantica]MBL0765262.1 TIGR04283 family arsenosugar biosynthesis glycosyltransferase [Marivirga atlantica]
MPQANNIRLSVIIPTLNEAANIQNLITLLKSSPDSNHIEIIVADANSTDNTADLAEQLNIKVISTKQASRAHQMNEGAKLAKANTLYFVHADVEPPKTFFKDINKHIKKGYDFGCFRFKFKSRHPLLFVNSLFTRFKFLWCRGGDQTLFIKKSLFLEADGFDERYVVMEDFELIKRLWKKNKFVVMPKSTLVSARKYDSNTYFQVNMANLKVFRMFMKGVEPEILKDTYYKLISHPKDC